MSLVVPNMPDNYDNAYIAVTPNNINDAASAISAAASDISNDLTDIYNGLKSLKLSWTGQASGSADDLNTQWQNAVNALYGSGQPGASQGALNTLIQAVSQLAAAYASTEQSIANMFNSIYQKMIAPPSGGVHGTAYQAVTDNGNDAPYYSTSVNET